MAYITCPECGEEVSEPSPTCSKCDAPPPKGARATPPQAMPAQRHKTHPITWVATAVIIPLLCWDAWQTYVDVKFGHAPPQSGQAPRPLGEKAHSEVAHIAAISELHSSYGRPAQAVALSGGDGPSLPVLTFPKTTVAPQQQER